MQLAMKMLRMQKEGRINQRCKIKKNRKMKRKINKK